MTILKSLLFFGLVCHAQAPVDETFAMRPAPAKVGDEYTYKMAVGLDGDDLKMEMEIKVHGKVVAVSEDGSYEMETTNLGGTVKFNGMEQPIEKEPSERKKYDKDDKEIKSQADKESDEEDSMGLGGVFELASPGHPDKPVKFGESWTSKKEFVDLKVTLVGRESYQGIACLKSESTAKLEKEGRSGDLKAKYLYNEKTFQPVFSDLTLEAYKFDDTSDPVKLHLKLELISN